MIDYATYLDLNITRNPVPRLGFETATLYKLYFNQFSL